jgi:hypothetical protein
MASDLSLINQHAIPNLRDSRGWNRFRPLSLTKTGIKFMFCLQAAEQAADKCKVKPCSADFISSDAIAILLQQLSAGSWPIDVIFRVNLISHFNLAFNNFNNQVKDDVEKKREDTEGEYKIKLINCAAAVANVQSKQDRILEIDQAAPEPQIDIKAFQHQQDEIYSRLIGTSDVQ